MSLNDEDAFAKQVKENLLEAVGEKNWSEAHHYANILRDNGYEEIFIDLWDNLNDEDRKDFLDYHDKFISKK